MFAIELPKCSCGRGELIPVVEAVMTLPGQVFAGLLCAYCDGGVLVVESTMMWAELEMLERGSWPRRVADLIDHPMDLSHWGTNCRCVVFPQVDPPRNPDSDSR